MDGQGVVNFQLHLYVEDVAPIPEQCPENALNFVAALGTIHSNQANVQTSNTEAGTADDLIAEIKHKRRENEAQYTKNRSVFVNLTENNLGKCRVPSKTGIQGVTRCESRGDTNSYGGDERQRCLYEYMVGLQRFFQAVKLIKLDAMVMRWPIPEPVKLHLDSDAQMRVNHSGTKNNAYESL